MEMFDQESGSRESSGRAKQLQKQKGCARMNKFDMMSKDALSKMEELMNASKLNELLHKKEEEDKKKTCILWILAIIGAVAAVAAIAYAISTMISMTTFSRMRRKLRRKWKKQQRKKMRTRRQRLKSSRTAGMAVRKVLCS